MKGRADYLKRGSWNAICDRCGRKFKAGDLKKEWDGLEVCSDCWEPRQPQDFVRSRPDHQAPPWTRPQGPNEFVPGVCTLEGISCIAGLAVADCSICDLIPSGLQYGP